MTRFTALLACGCIVFPADGTRLDRAIENAFGDPFARHLEGLCLLHGRQAFVVGIRNGSGAVMGIA